MTEPEQTPHERWHKGECYQLVLGPHRLIIWESGDPEYPWHWVAEHGKLKRSDGYADNGDEAKRRAERAAVLQWLLVALETGNQPEGFHEHKKWLFELKECLDFERYAGGIWHVGEPEDEKEEVP